VIYRLVDEVRSRLQDLLPRVVEHKVLGEATVQQVFDVKGKGKTILKIAGCRVTNGVIERAKSVRVLRSGQEIYSGT
jgi:translation initiation factor IF-2